VSDINKDFIDDVITEINILIASRPPGEDGLLTSKIRPTSIPLPALKDIERSLGYHDYPTKSRMVDLSEEEHPHYASLGAVGNFTDTLLMWVYDRQCDCDPQNKPYYLDCLSGIAKGRKSSDLETKVVLATSAGELGLEETQEAYKFFTLDATTKELDDHIIGLYRSRIDSAPRQKDEARQCLRVIAKHRASQKIQAVVNDKTMDYNEALEFLGVTEETASDSIEAVAIARVSRPYIQSLKFLLFPRNIYLRLF
jgi:ubiquitin carboxyl-terminal hydrolase 25/28